MATIAARRRKTYEVTHNAFTCFRSPEIKPIQNEEVAKCFSPNYALKILEYLARENRRLFSPSGRALRLWLAKTIAEKRLS